MCAPLIGPVSLQKYLSHGQIENVSADGENYDGARPCHYEWVKSLYEECKAANVSFSFFGTGYVFVKDGKTYRLSGEIEREQAQKSGLNFQGKPACYHLADPLD